MKVIDEDVLIILYDMLVPVNKKSKKVVVNKKFLDNVPVVRLNNISFHSKEKVMKWKYIYRMCIAPER